ncbi:hypothetical protein BGZ94_003590 [Podila epigama]|nr:hypothetical protein BGZ94_003590 [Podila epigama]
MSETNGLEKFQEEIESFNKEADKIEQELVAKRFELMTPLYEKRRAICSQIPQFWLTVFRNHMGLAQIIEEDDVPALEHLTDVWVKVNPKEVRTFDVIFTFSDNEYFTNKELIKKVIFKDDEQVAEPFTINWKEGKDLTKGKRKKGAEQSDSFFSYFNDEDVTIAQFIASELFPEALSIYANDDDDEFDDSEGSIALSGEEDEDEDEDDDEEDEEPAKKKSKK